MRYVMTEPGTPTPSDEFGMQSGFVTALAGSRPAAVRDGRVVWRGARGDRCRQSPGQTVRCLSLAVLASCTGAVVADLGGCVGRRPRSCRGRRLQPLLQLEEAADQVHLAL